MRNPQLESYVSGLPALTPEAIQADLNEQKYTYQRVPLDLLEAYLNTNGLLRQLRAVIANPSTPAPLSGGLQDFLDHLASRSTTLDVVDPSVRAKFNAVLDALKQVLPAQSTQWEVIRSMGISSFTLAIQQFGHTVTLPEIQEAVLRAQLKRQLASVYNQALVNLDGADLPPVSLSSLVTPLLG